MKIAFLVIAIAAIALILFIKKSPKKESNGTNLVEQVKLAINPKFQDWVLYSNGTYIIIEELAEGETHESYGNKMMEEFGPVSTGGPAGDFSVTTLNKTDGWSISGHGFGMYTYVHPNELESANPDDVEVGLHGRSKRHRDSQEQQIIYTNKSNEL